MNKWLIDSIYQTAPTKIEVLSESECFAKIRIIETEWSGRCRKENQIFDTFADAKDYMVAQSLDRLARAKQEVARAQEKHDALIAMEEPHD
jgi:hypothetical protein